MADPNSDRGPGPKLTIGADPTFAEQFPLAPIDDFMIHQTTDPIRVMMTSDPRAYERSWMVCHDDSGEILVATGLSMYPNLDRAEAYAIVNHRGVQRTVRAFRRIGADRMDMRLGPIAPEVVEGMRRWRFVLEPNEWGISFDLDFRDSTRQVFREPTLPIDRGFPAGRRPDVTTGFESFGDVTGWVDVEGTRVELSEGSGRGTRDRHWGIGRGVGGPELALGGRMHVGVNGNSFVAFENFTIWGDKVFYRFGDPRPGAGRVANVVRRMRFEPDTKIFLEGLVDYTLDSGETKQLHYQRLGNQTAYLRCGMYGGTPDKGIHQGGYTGEDELVEGDAFDCNLAEVRASLVGLDEHLCRVTCDGETTTGLMQPIDPNAYNACASPTREGWSFWE
ncbi:MAG: hypothetical protein OEY23_25170 [Acidimicrobiia bacterium]|nr:hypothetical protein [Acidimicrobiia bacterium]